MCDTPGKEQLLDSNKHKSEGKYSISDEEPNSPDTTRKSISTEQSFQAEEGSLSDGAVAIIPRDSTISFRLSSLSFDCEVEGKNKEKVSNDLEPMELSLSKTEESKIIEEEIKLVPIPKLTEIKHPEINSSSFFHQESESNLKTSNTKEALNTHEQHIYPSSNQEYSSPSSQDALNNESLVTNKNRKIDKNYCVENLPIPRVSPETKNSQD